MPLAFWRPWCLLVAVGFAVVSLGGCAPNDQTATDGPSTPPPSPTATAPHPTATPALSLIRLYRGDPLPDPHLTPGTATAGVSLTSICENTYAASIPRVPDATARQVFARYHISYNDRASYELDHLIPLELGGDNSIRNLWPEEGPSPNSKDYLEIRLHNQVCKNKLSLSEAQRLISTNWAAEFLKGGGSHKLSTGPPKPPKQPKKPKKKHASPSPSPTH